MALWQRVCRGLAAVWARSTPASRFRHADRLRNEGRYDEAARLVAQGLREDPTSSVGHLLSAYLHVSARAIDRAKADFHRVLELDPYHPRALLGLARISIEEHDLDSAKEFLDRALRYYTAFPEARALHEMVVSWSSMPAPSSETPRAAAVGESATLERDVVVARVDGTLVLARADAERAGQIARHLVQVYRMASATLSRAGLGGLRRSVIDTGSHMTFVLSDADHVLSATLEGGVETSAGFARAARLWTEIGVKA